MKVVTLILLFVASCSLTGCFQWDTTRAVHQWGENSHSFASKPVKTEATEAVGWTSYDFPFYSFKGVFYVERNYLLNGHTDDSGRINFYRTRAISFDQLLFAKHKLLNAEYAQTAQGTGEVLWDHIAVYADEAFAVRSSDGYMLRVDYQTVLAGDATAQRQQNCRIMHKGIREDDGSWVVLAEAFPRQGQDDPPGKFMAENPLYKFVTARAVFKNQPIYLHVIKFPLYILTVPFDFITAPFQALAKIRVGP